MISRNRVTGWMGLLLGAVVLASVGCTTHSRNAGSAIERMKIGDTASALKWSENLKHSSVSKDLGYLESGRIEMLTGDFESSRSNYAVVIDKHIEQTEAGPAIRMGSVGGTLAASTVADDTVRKYELSPYELIQLLHYQTLNYLFMGDPDGANVEMRRTVFAQNAIAEKYAKEVANGAPPGDTNQVKAMAAVQKEMAAMGPVLERTSSAHENGLAWYFCGLMFEKQGDKSNAGLSYRKAWELAPANTCVLKDFLRMLRTQDQQAFNDLVQRNSIDVNTLTRSSTELVVIYEESLISQRQAVKIPIPIPDFRGAITLVSADYPVYKDAPYAPIPLAIADEAADLGATEPAVYLQSLAYRDLKDEIPGVTARNISRAITKIAAQQVANNQNNNYVKLAMMIANAASTLAMTADTRSWYTIPMVTHLFRGPVSAGQHTLHCRNPATGMILDIPITVVDGETRVVWIANTGGLIVSATAPLSRIGAPPSYAQLNNPFVTNLAPVVVAGMAASNAVSLGETAAPAASSPPVSAPAADTPQTGVAVPPAPSVEAPPAAPVPALPTETVAAPPPVAPPSAVDLQAAVPPVSVKDTAAPAVPVAAAPAVPASDLMSTNTTAAAAAPVAAVSPEVEPVTHKENKESGI